MIKVSLANRILFKKPKVEIKKQKAEELNYGKNHRN